MSFNYNPILKISYKKIQNDVLVDELNFIFGFILSFLSKKLIIYLNVILWKKKMEKKISFLSN